jgi:hypothetical protein
MPSAIQQGSSLRRLEECHGDCGFLYSDQAATVLREGNARTVNLAGPRLASQLEYEFVDLRESGCTDGVTAGLQSSRGVHWDEATECGVSAHCRGSAIPVGHESHVLDLLHLADYARNAVRWLT